MAGGQAAPVVTVLISVHNGGPFVEQAVRSMMDQTLREIEIVVVDDGSTDGTPDVLAQLAAEDGRIRVERLTENLRLPRALNRGLDLVRAPLVARMDADDVAHPERLAVQKRYMDAYRGVVAVGTSLRRVREDGQAFQTTVRPRDALMCRWIMRFRLPFVNPTTMFRQPLPDGTRLLYDPAYPNAEDHDFYGRMMAHGALVCLPDILLDYRHHGRSLTHSRWTEQTQLAKRICLGIMARELPAEVVGSLRPAVAGFFDFERTPAGGIVGGFRAMLRHDLAAFPRHRAWLRRQTAQLALDTLTRSGRSKRDAALALARHGPDLLPHLAMRLAEIGRVLPRALETHPDVWTDPGAGAGP